MFFIPSFFYLFAFFAVVSGFGLIFSTCVTVSALWLLFAFYNVIGVMILLATEFLTISTIGLYIGAMMILFFLIITIMDIEPAKIRYNARKNFGLTCLYLCVFSAWLLCSLNLCLVYLTGEDFTKSIAPLEIDLAVASATYHNFITPFFFIGLTSLVGAVIYIGIALRHKKKANSKASLKKTKVLFS